MTAKREHKTTAQAVAELAETYGVDPRTAAMIDAYARRLAELMPPPDDDQRERLRVLFS